MFLNQERLVPPADYPRSTVSLLWDYNLHYFDGLLAAAPSERQKSEWIQSWIECVPPGAKPAWDPYPASRRIANWIKWAGTTDERLPVGFLDNLAAQVRHLEQTLEYHLLANHLLANAVSLAMAGSFFGGEEGNRWLKRGMRLLEAELKGQFLSDGAHFELSPVYHAIVLEDLLDLLQVADGYGVAVRGLVEPTVQVSLEWLQEMVRPDGRLPLFNDAAYGLGPEPIPLFAYAEGRGFAPSEQLAPGLRLLAGSGYLRYASGRLFVLGDVGEVGPSYQPGHAHCDMLSFELCWDGLPIIVDTGTSTYEMGERRMVERGTAAHNTVQVGGREQSEIWASFRVARRARLLSRTVETDRIAGAIRAFPPRWVEHHRTWNFDGESLAVADRVEGARAAERRATARLHFHPEVRLVRAGDSWLANDLEIRFDGAKAVREAAYHYAPEFNRLIPARCLEIDFEGLLHTYFSP